MSPGGAVETGPVPTRALVTLLAAAAAATPRLQPHRGLTALLLCTAAGSLPARTTIDFPAHSRAPSVPRPAVAARAP